jgi:hypothetical protein
VVIAAPRRDSVGTGIAHTNSQSGYVITPFRRADQIAFSRRVPRFDAGAGTHRRRMCNPQGYLILRSSLHARESTQSQESEMFIFHDLVDLFALFGLMQLGRVLMKRRHKVT